MGDNNINFLTYNVKGLQQKQKRVKIYNYVKEKVKHGCVLLQETHSSDNDQQSWETEWGEKLYQNHGTSNSRGVSIGFTKNFDYTELKYEQDICGRLQLLSFKHEEDLFLIINLYNNNNEGEQVDTLKKLELLLSQFDNILEHKIIIGGDWNFIQNVNLDALGGNPGLKLNSIAELLKIKQKYDLCDIFRVRHPLDKSFTYFRRTPRLARRLDFFLVSNSIQDKIEKCATLTSLSSDHSPVLLAVKITNNEFKRGRNYWKFNNSLINNQNFCDELIRKIETEKQSLAEIEPQMKWELIKFKIRQFTRTFSKKLAMEKRENELKWEEIVKGYETSVFNNVTENEYRVAKDGLENLHNEKTAGYILRSKIQWYEEGEKSTKFFLNLEKKKAIQNTIKTLIDEERTLTDSEDISKAIKRFYVKLFEKREVTDCPSFLSNLGLPTLSEDEKRLCEVPFSLEDIKVSLDSMVNNKSPGNDGLTKEFYDKFWLYVNDLLYDSYMAGFMKKELSTSQRQAIIKLLEKKDRDRRFIKNWRPISLLNIDVKLLSKTLASRLKDVLPSIIHSDQTAYVSGRFIGESARVIADILETSVKLNMEGYILTMDIEKAFDSMDHSFLIEALKAYGFGETFITWIQIMLNNQESCVMNGGMTTGYFNLSRGARQGDPISAYLFVIVLEVFFVMIRKNQNINGLNICNFEYKLTAYADDTTFFCSDLNSAINIIDTFNNFSRYSGLKVNTDKCEICGIGVKRGDEIALCGMKCVDLENDSIKILGVHYSYNDEIVKSKNYLEVIESIENVISVWRMRGLTLGGKITVLKTLVMSKIVFISFLSNVPTLIIDKLITIQNDFLWDGKRAKVKHAALIGSYETGGLKSLDIKAKIKALQLSWVRRLYDGTNHAWKNIPLFYFSKQTDKIFYPNLEINPDVNMPTFYKNLIKYWTEISKYNPATANAILAQRLQFNCFIKIDDRSITWKFPNVLFIKHLLDTNGLFLDWQNFKNKYLLENNHYFKWMQLINAVPTNWKIILRRDRGEGILEPRQHLLKTTRLLTLERLTCKELYNIFVAKLKESPTTERTIQELLNASDIDWTKAYILARKVTIENYSRIFHFKTTHNILYLNKVLHRMQISATSLCSFCHTDHETIMHLYSQCPIILNIWSQLKSYFSGTLILPPLTPQSAFLGFHTINENKIIINQILLTFKIVIYKSREGGFCNLLKIINKLKKTKLIEDAISVKDEHKKRYNDFKWSGIRFIN